MTTQIYQGSTPLPFTRLSQLQNMAIDMARKYVRGTVWEGTRQVAIIVTLKAMETVCPHFEQACRYLTYKKLNVTEMRVQLQEWAPYLQRIGTPPVLFDIMYTEPLALSDLVSAKFYAPNDTTLLLEKRSGVSWLAYPEDLYVNFPCLRNKLDICADLASDGADMATLINQSILSETSGTTLAHSGFDVTLPDQIQGL